MDRKIIFKYCKLVIPVYFIFILFITVNGFFNIGMLSDTYMDTFASVNSSLIDKFTGNIPMKDNIRFRPFDYLFLQIVPYLKIFLGFPYDIFLFNNIINLILYISFSFFLGLFVLESVKKVNYAVFASVLILIFPNNLHNLCWTTATCELRCGVFFILTLLFYVKYLENKNNKNFLFCILFFVLAILTKETSLIIPFVCFFYTSYLFGFEKVLKLKKINFTFILILVLYFLYRISLISINPLNELNVFSSDYLKEVLNTLLKSVISLLLPFDYISLKLYFSSFNWIIIIYTFVIFILGLYLLIYLLKNKYYDDITNIVFIVLISVLPYMYAGYVRPQIILIPFSIFVIFIISIIFKRNVLLSQHYKILLILLVVFVCVFWLVVGKGVINNWGKAYIESKKNIDGIMNTEFNQSNKTVIIGNPSRVLQYFMFDNLTGAYNYWKYKDFVVKDTIYDIVKLGDVDFESINSGIKHHSIDDNNFEISTINMTQFFYVSGYETKIKYNNKISADLIDIEVMELSKLNKPSKILITLKKDNVDLYVMDKSKLIKLN